MKPIQFVLVPLLLFWLVLFWVRLKRQPWLRGLVACVLGTALLFTVYPESSTWLAHTLGVGRGVDMVIYLGMVGLTAGMLLLYLRVQALQQQVLTLTRELTLQQARPPQKNGETPLPSPTSPLDPT